jgi:hypothetical protein
MVRAALVALALAVAGCAGSTPAASSPPSSETPAATAPGPTPVPNPGGGVAPNPGGGIVDPNLDPLPVAPVPGVTDVRQVAAETLVVEATGPKALATLTWTSGVEPCTALAGIGIARADREITLTIREGNGAGPDIACTAQAIRKTATVDLGELAPGLWVVRAGDAPAVEVLIEG